MTFHAIQRKCQRGVRTLAISSAREVGDRHRVGDSIHSVLRKADLKGLEPHLRNALASYTGLIVIEVEGVIVTVLRNEQPSRYVGRKQHRRSLRSHRGSRLRK